LVSRVVILHRLESACINSTFQISESYYKIEYSQSFFARERKKANSGGNPINVILS
jgi:hypothetical protein